MQPQVATTVVNMEVSWPGASWRNRKRSLILYPVALLLLITIYQFTSFTTKWKHPVGAATPVTNTVVPAMSRLVNGNENHSSPRPSAARNEADNDAPVPASSSSALTLGTNASHGGLLPDLSKSGVDDGENGGGIGSNGNRVPEHGSKAYVGQAVKNSSLDITFFHIAQPPSRTNNTLVVWIVNYDLAAKWQYSVHAVSDEKFTRAALQTRGTCRVDSCSNVTIDGQSSRFIEFTVALPPGSYSINAYQFKAFAKQVNILPLRNGTQLFSLHVADPTEASSAVAMRSSSGSLASALPPCQKLESVFLVPGEGMWVGPEGDLPLSSGKMRNGWTFEPDRCSLETFSYDDIQTASKEPLSIVVIGTSQDRGVFLSMVDMVLKGEEKRDIAASEIAKCWGRINVRLNNLELTFQDFRPNLCNVDEPPGGQLICHGDKLAKDHGYYQNVTKMVHGLFYSADNGERLRGPDVITLHADCSAMVLAKRTEGSLPKCMALTLAVVSLIPPEWNGTVYIGSSFLRGLEPDVDKAELDRYSRSLLFFQKQFNDTRIRVLDFPRLSTDMKFYRERVGLPLSANHHHRFCEVSSNRSSPAPHDTYVCSNVTEAVANLLIGRAIAPMGKEAWRKGLKYISDKGRSSNGVRKTIICTDCPVGLLPFHVKPIPNLQCQEGHITPTNKPKTGRWQVASCPARCLATKPVGSVNTQSGPVAVRECSVADSTLSEAIARNAPVRK